MNLQRCRSGGTAVTTRVLFVRAVNVGGTARLPMADFRRMLEDLGALRAQTYIASGNAVIDLPGEWTSTEIAAFDHSVECELESRFGFCREVISRSLPALEDALATHPFAVADPKWSYVAFLSAAPDVDNTATARQLPTGKDQWELAGAELHMRFDAGFGAASLDSTALLKRLGVVGTARNLRTVQAIIDLASR